MQADLIIEKMRSVFTGEFNVGYIKRQAPRYSDAFVIYTKGEADYIFDKGDTLRVKAGDVIYLPCDGMYNIDVREGSKYICIDFYFAESSAVRKPHVCKSAGKNTEMDFLRAFHTWMQNGSDRTPRVLGILYGIYASIIAGDRKKYTRTSDHFRKACEVILQSYGSPDLSVEALSKAVGLSRAHLGRIFIENARISPIGYIIFIRCEQAKKLIESSNLSIGEIAESVGFADPLYFSRIFKKSVGISPTEYRKRYRQ